MSADRPDFSHQPRWSLGIEVGDLALVLVLLERVSPHQLALRARREVTVPEDIGMGSSGFARLLGEQVADVTAGIHGSVPLWTALNPDHVRVHQVEVTALNEGQLPSSVFWAVQREEAFEAADHLLDFEIEAVEPTRGKRGKKFSVTAYVVANKALSNLEHIFLAAGYPLSGIVLPLKALGNVVAGNWLKPDEEVLAYCHIGKTTSRIAIIEASRVGALRGIPVGMESIAKAVADEFQRRLKPAEALRLMLEANKGSVAQEMLQSADPGLERLARQIERTISWFQNQTRKYGSVARVFTGGDLNAYPQLAERLRGHLSLPLEEIDPFRHPAIQVNASLPPPTPSPGVFSTAMGLAMTPGLKGQNFLKPFPVRRKEQSSHLASKAIFAAFLLLVLAIGSLYGFALLQRSEAREEYQATLRQVEALDPAHGPRELHRSLNELQADRATLSRIAREEEAPAILAEISRITPPEIRLVQLAATLNPEPSEEAATPTKTVSIDGLSRGNGIGDETLVRLYARNLQTSPLFHSVAVQAMNARPGRTHDLKFTLILELAGSDTQPPAP